MIHTGIRIIFLYLEQDGVSPFKVHTVRHTPDYLYTEQDIAILCIVIVGSEVRQPR